MNNSLLIKNGTLIDSYSTYKADILIESGVITTISGNIEIQGIETINASGMFVMPGAVDVHTHINIDVGIAQSADNFGTGTIAAACGGTTTMVDHMGFGKSGRSLQSRVDKYHEYADGNAVIDYSFHGVLQHIAKYHALSRPESCEIEAIERVIGIAKMANNSPLHIVHVSTAEGAKKIKEAINNNQNIYAETCTQCLVLDDTNYEKEDGLKYIMSPPLRSRENIDAER